MYVCEEHYVHGGVYGIFIIYNSKKFYYYYLLLIIILIFSLKNNYFLFLFNKKKIINEFINKFEKKWTNKNNKTKII